MKHQSTLAPASPSEAEILALSLEKFRWKTSDAYDLLANLFDDDLAFVHITGHLSSKQEWMAELRSGRFHYDRIEHKGSSVKTYGSTAVLVGRAAFHVSINGYRSTYHLVYTEVYAQKAGHWKLVNIHTCSG